jgi:hypothetical protein
MKAILVLSAFGLSVASANACNMQRSVQANVDQTVVASVTTAAPAMSKPILPLPAPTVDEAAQTVQEAE